MARKKNTGGVRGAGRERTGGEVAGLLGPGEGPAGLLTAGGLLESPAGGGISSAETNRLATNLLSEGRITTGQYSQGLGSLSFDQTANIIGRGNLTESEAGILLAATGNTSDIAVRAVMRRAGRPQDTEAVMAWLASRRG